MTTRSDHLTICTFPIISTHQMWSPCTFHRDHRAFLTFGSGSTDAIASAARGAQGRACWGARSGSTGLSKKRTATWRLRVELCRDKADYEFEQKLFKLVGVSNNVQDQLIQLNPRKHHLWDTERFNFFLKTLILARFFEQMVGGWCMIPVTRFEHDLIIQ